MKGLTRNKDSIRAATSLATQAAHRDAAPRVMRLLMQRMEKVPLTSMSVPQCSWPMTGDRNCCLSPRTSRDMWLDLQGEVWQGMRVCIALNGWYFR